VAFVESPGRFVHLEGTERQSVRPPLPGQFDEPVAETVSPPFRVQVKLLQLRLGEHEQPDDAAVIHSHPAFALRHDNGGAGS
jgi:hypothetical protein